MNNQEKSAVKIIDELLEKFKNDEIDKCEITEKIKGLYFEDIGFAKIDHHRAIRKNFPEVVFGANKTPEQILAISERILSVSSLLLITHASPSAYELITQKIKNVSFKYESNIIYTPLNCSEKSLKEGITVICAGTSDIPIAEEAAITGYLMKNKVKKIYDVGVAGIHRLISFKEVLFNSNVIVTVAGMDGALPTVVSSIVECPVIGVPTSVGYGASFNGIAPLLTMLNSCSPGVMVVNINNGFGAGYAAGIINKNIHNKK